MQIKLLSTCFYHLKVHSQVWENLWPLKALWICFLFLSKSSFISLGICIFVMTFWSCRKNGLFRKIRLTSKFMMSQPGLQTIAMHILPNISQSKGNQTMKFGQFIEYNKINIFLQNLWRKWGRETSTRPLFVCLKKHYMR